MLNLYFYLDTEICRTQTAAKSSIGLNIDVVMKNNYSTIYSRIDPVELLVKFVIHW